MSGPLLTPGLTPRQRERLHLHITQLAGRTAHALALDLYADADRLAGRWLSSPQHCGEAPILSAVASLIESHPGSDCAVAAYLAGLAQGVRFGKSCAPDPAPRSKWISEEYQQLSDAGRREIAAAIRKRLKTERPPVRHRRIDPQIELEAALTWRGPGAPHDIGRRRRDAAPLQGGAK